jgi:scyllo-inositol 2-dehydrogenase (NADP+)
MKVVIIGLGIQGKKRLAVAGPHVTATVDPFVPTADFKNIEQVPLDRYEAAIVSTPDQQKIDILSYLLANGKHVLVEKPLLADQPETFRRLQSLAEKNGVTCWTAYNHRFEPNLVRLREVIRSGVLGKIYHARFFYGNGTAADVRKSPWRDKGLGVISDLGSHLFDLTDFLLDVRPQFVEPWACERFENQAYDHVLLGAPIQPALQFEMSLLSWRNTFHAEITAEKGSAQVHCLCKWGPSSLIVRRRIFPSGKPTEEVHTVERADPTWEAEYAEFLNMCAGPCNSLAKDMWINSLFDDLNHQLVEQAASPVRAQCA